MKYRYTSYFPPEPTDKLTKRPIVEIDVLGPKGKRTFEALIDSGADVSLFNTNIAVLLGFDLSYGKPSNLRGISGGLEGRTLEKIEIQVEGMDSSILIPVSFVFSDSVGILLGQEGFFDQYRIKFEKDHDTFEIVPVRK